MWRTTARRNNFETSMISAAKKPQKRMRAQRRTLVAYLALQGKLTPTRRPAPNPSPPLPRTWPSRAIALAGAASSWAQRAQRRHAHSSASAPSVARGNVLKALAGAPDDIRIIFTDVNMPGSMDGAETGPRRARAMAAKIIVTSGYGPR
jgi:hypothetical protein